MPSIAQGSPAGTIASSPAEFNKALVSLLKTIRSISDDVCTDLSQQLAEPASIPDTLKSAISVVRSASPLDADALSLALEKTIDSPSHGGLGITSSSRPTEEDYEDALFLVSAHLTALNHKPLSFMSTISQPSSETQPMTLTQKVFALHSLSNLPATGLQTGSVVRVGVDWILASELSWQSMAHTHEDLGNPGIWRNNCFWLAGDHLVHSNIRQVEKIKAIVNIAEKAKKMFQMTEYQGMNYTIMHTEFVRERAELDIL